MKNNLRFHDNGKFKMMMFSDLQDKLPINPKSLALLDTLLETEKPDFVISVGDHCNGSVESIREFKKYVTSMSDPMESRGIHWSHVFGNHDDEFISSALCDKVHQMQIFEDFKYCLSERGP
jgi:metallophosphoesterase superfamily enzyme